MKKRNVSAVAGVERRILQHPFVVMTSSPLTSAFGPVRFVDLGPKLLAGLRRHHPFADAPRTIPQQWVDFNETVRPALPKSEVFYGAICGSTESTCEYMCAVAVPSFDSLPPEMGRMRLLPQHYAVFQHSGHVGALHATWCRIIDEWLPQSGFVSAERPDFELYTESYDPATGTGGIEVWVGVTPRS